MPKKVLEKYANILYLILNSLPLTCDVICSKLWSEKVWGGNVRCTSSIIINIMKLIDYLWWYSKCFPKWLDVDQIRSSISKKALFNGFSSYSTHWWWRKLEYKRKTQGFLHTVCNFLFLCQIYFWADVLEY